MSQNIPLRRERNKKVDYKVRTGFTEEQLEDWKEYLRAHGYGPGGKPETSFTNRALLLAIGKTPVDIGGLDL